MAWVQKSSSGKYIGKYRGPDNKVRTAKGGPFTHKTEARRRAAAAEAESRSLGWRDPEAASRTWSDWHETWIKTRDVSTNTSKGDVSRITHHLMPRWGDVQLADITRGDIRLWIGELRAGSDTRKALGPDSVRRCVHLLSASLRVAVDAEVLPANPAAQLLLPAGQKSIERYLTAEEIAAVHDHLETEKARALFLFLIGTGLRWGEAVGLHWWRVAADGKSLVVAEAWSGGDLAIKPWPKGKKPRVVPVHDWVPLGERTDDRRCDVTHLPGSPCRSGLVFTGLGGKLWQRTPFRDMVNRAAKAADVEHFRVHDFRHTFASHGLQGEEDDDTRLTLAEIGDLLGHRAPQTTQRYTHLGQLDHSRIRRAYRNPLEPRPKPPTDDDPTSGDDLAERRRQRDAG